MLIAIEVEPEPEECQAGEGRGSDGVCAVCPFNTYSNNEKCVDCPFGYSSSPGSSSIDDCIAPTQVSTRKYTSHMTYITRYDWLLIVHENSDHLGSNFQV